MTPDMESFLNRHNIRPIALGPGTPWPNRAEAAIRMFKKQLTLTLTSLSEDPLLANVTYRQVMRQAALARNSMVTYGGVTPLELAFGRRPADLLSPETMTPPQLTSEAPCVSWHRRNILKPDSQMTLGKILHPGFNLLMVHSSQETRSTIGQKTNLR